MFKFHYSYRRQLIDRELSKLSISGRVLDLGGKKINKRGEFKPNAGSDWTYMNINPAEGADVIANGEEIPAKDNSFDWVLCVEVLEFVQNPDRFIFEISRVLKSKGKLLLTAPFLYRVHGKPNDLQRFTDQKLKKLTSQKFEIKTLNAQGYFFTVLADFLKSAVAQVRRVWLRYLLALFILPFVLLFRFLDEMDWICRSDFFTSFTTGYVLFAEKR